MSMNDAEAVHTIHPSTNLHIIQLYNEWYRHSQRKEAQPLRDGTTIMTNQQFQLESFAITHLTVVCMDACRRCTHTDMAFWQ